MQYPVCHSDTTTSVELLHELWLQFRICLYSTACHSTMGDLQVPGQQVEVPELPKGLEEEILDDIRNREDLSADNLPSAIFYTFVNTHQSLNCASFSRTGAYVAGAGQG